MHIEKNLVEDFLERPHRARVMFHICIGGSPITHLGMSKNQGTQGLAFRTANAFSARGLFHSKAIRSAIPDARRREIGGAHLTVSGNQLFLNFPFKRLNFGM
jgi:hypothetical protein